MSARIAFADSHAHLCYVAERSGGQVVSAILADWAAAWDGATAAGESGPLIVDPGVEPGDLPERRRVLAALSPGGLIPPFLRLAAGVWPGRPSLDDPEAAAAALEAAVAAAPKGTVAAIGEAGLDYYHDEGPREAQAALFEAQLDLAARLGLPVIVHSRDAASDTLPLVRAAARRGATVVMHCFGYGAPEARLFLDAGCHLSFAGNLTYKAASALREACALAPLDRLLLETDSPYMNPLPLRGRPSTPRDIARTYEAAAALRGCAPEELARAVAANALRVFGAGASGR